MSQLFWVEVPTSFSSICCCCRYLLLSFAKSFVSLRKRKRKILFQTSPPFAFGILSKTFPPSFRSKWRSLQPWLKRFIQAAAPNQVLFFFSLFSSFLALIYIFLLGSLGFFFFLRVFVLVCPKCEISCAAGRLNNRWETSPPPPARESPSHIPIKVERKDFSCPFLSSSPTRWV